MRFDALLQRHFRWALALVLSIGVYFQAAGIGQLVVAMVLGADDANAGAAKGRQKTVSAPARREWAQTTSISERNFFDSVTGPLNATELDLSDEQEARPDVDLSNPALAPRCPTLITMIVTETPDPLWSMAIVKADANSKGELHRVGDKITDFEIVFIGFNPLNHTPAVWYTGPNGLCQVPMWASEAPPPPKAEAPAPAAAAAGGDVPTEISSRIQKVSETEFNLDRAVVDNVLDNQATLMRSVRVVPEKEGDTVVGIRLFGVRPNTILGMLGMQNGDRLDQINGLDMGSPEKALEAYARLRTASKLAIKVNRRGKPLTLDINIK